MLMNCILLYLVDPMKQLTKLVDTTCYSFGKVYNKSNEDLKLSISTTMSLILTPIDYIYNINQCYVVVQI